MRNETHGLWRRLAGKLTGFFGKCIYYFSGAVVATVSVVGALVGFSRGDATKPIVSIWAFLVALPIVFVAFGPTKATFFATLAVTIGLLFLSNLHAAVGVVRSMRKGGLSYIMERQRVEAAEAVTPTEEGKRDLWMRATALEAQVGLNAADVAAGTLKSHPTGMGTSIMKKKEG